MHMAHKRPAVDMPDELESDVDKYAEENGLRKPRAYAELLKAGLEAEDQR